jgi:anti-sigma-K factor RskA
MNAHPICEEDFDLYALGALEGDELREMESHIAGCRDCAGKLAQAKGRVAMLALAAPPVNPSPAAKAALLARVATEGRSLPARDARQAPAPPARWWQMVLVPAVGALAILAIVLWQQNAQLDKQLALLHDSVAKQQAQMDEVGHVVALIGSTDTVTVHLAAQPGMPQGTAHVMYNMKMKMLMYDGQLDATPAGKSYQLWVVPMNGNPVSAGVFNPTQGQIDHWMMNMPEGMVPKAFAVTLEPAGGMPQPTGPMVLKGSAAS